MLIRFSSSGRSSLPSTRRPRPTGTRNKLAHSPQALPEIPNLAIFLSPLVQPPPYSSHSTSSAQAGSGLCSTSKTAQIIFVIEKTRFCSQYCCGGLKALILLYCVMALYHLASFFGRDMYSKIWDIIFLLSCLNNTTEEYIDPRTTNSF